jgi:hypothetical protein
MANIRINGQSNQLHKKLLASDKPALRLLGKILKIVWYGKFVVFILVALLMVGIVAVSMIGGDNTPSETQNPTEIVEQVTNETVENFSPGIDVE